MPLWFLLVGGAGVAWYLFGRGSSSTPSTAAAPPSPAPATPATPLLATGLPAGYGWLDQGNTTPIDTQLLMGQTSDAAVMTPNGTTLHLVGMAQVAAQGVSFTHVADGTWNAQIGPVQLPLSYVVPRPVPAGSGFAQPG